MKITEWNGVAQVRITITKPTGSGRRVGWVKLVTGIDRTQKGGFALQGEFLNEGEQDLPAGAVQVRCSPNGSAKSGDKEYACRNVGGSLLSEEDGKWSAGYDQCSPTFLDVVQGKLNVALQIQGAAKATLDPAVLDSILDGLKRYTDEQLIAELERRGVVRSSWDGTAREVV